MDNKEIFQKMKELNQLKIELHKQEMASFFSLKTVGESLDPNWDTMLSIGKLGYTVYKKLKPIIKD